MKFPGGSSSRWSLAIGIALAVLSLTTLPALASLTFSGTAISVDSGIVIDGPGTISIGTSTATEVTIGNGSSTISLLGNVGIGTTTPSVKLEVDSVNDPLGEAASFSETTNIAEASSDGAWATSGYAQTFDTGSANATVLA